MKRIILFRFHGSLDICGNRLAILLRLNPGARIFGLWGGDSAGILEARQDLAAYLEDIWPIPVASSLWKWQHADLALMMWFKAVGRHLPFDMLHFVEWDVLFLASLDEIYGDLGRNGVALAGLTPPGAHPARLVLDVVGTVCLPVAATPATRPGPSRVVRP